MGPQDSLAFTGSAATGLKLRSNPNLLKHSVRVNIEADSLNAAVLGPDMDLESETGRLFVKNVALDMRQKTGQKCTAVRRILVPHAQLADVRERLLAQLGEIVVGDPSDSTTTMGPLASKAQLTDVTAGIARLAEAAKIVTGSAEPAADKGFFVSPTLLETDTPEANIFHDEEVFGPVATLLPYDGSAAGAADLVNRGQGSLVGSLYCEDSQWLQDAVLCHGSLARTSLARQPEDGRAGPPSRHGPAQHDSRRPRPQPAAAKNSEASVAARSTCNALPFRGSRV